MHLHVLSAHIGVYHVHSWCIWRPGEGAGYSGTGAVGGRERSWEWSPGPLQDQPVLLAAEPFSSLSSFLSLTSILRPISWESGSWLEMARILGRRLRRSSHPAGLSGPTQFSTYLNCFSVLLSLSLNWDMSAPAGRTDSSVNRNHLSRSTPTSVCK